MAGAIYVAGLGIKEVDHLTLESHALVHKVDEVAYMELNSNRVAQYLGKIGTPGENLVDWYIEGQERQRVYERIAEYIVEEAIRGKHVCYLAPGNPFFLNRIVEVLDVSCQSAGIPFSIQSGVSSIDTIITDLRLPVAEFGMQCYVAGNFCIDHPTIDTSVPLILFQPGVVGNPTIKLITPPTSADMSQLQKYLCELYGPAAKWLLIGSASTSEEPPLIAHGVLGELNKFSEIMLFGTLVMPGRWWPRWINTAT